jgi:hypothetical protein
MKKFLLTFVVLKQLGISEPPQKYFDYSFLTPATGLR